MIFLTIQNSKIMNDNLKTMLEGARRSSRMLNRLTDADINRVLLKAADAAVAATDSILAANAADLARMSKDDPKYDRLMLTADRIASIANDMRSVAALPSPLGVTLREWTQPNGMKIRKVSVPFGVIGIIYEARPNVTFDVFSLCLKSGSACVLKGGSDADSSNRTIVEVLRGVLLSEGIDEACVTLLPPDHATTQEMLGAVGYVDLVIPRGSSRLINFVRDNARIPVIETGAGVCHCYIHSSADILKAQAIVTNSKTRRVSVCNALDSLVIDESRLADLPIIVEKMAAKKVEIRADERAFAALDGKYPYLSHADDSDWGREYIDYRMSIRTVASLADAIDHISRFTSHHSESIVAEDEAVCDTFTREIDAACVYTNLPTSFTDGGQFGFGAEIGISTQKLHARGPMGLPEITTYKYIISGNGQTRNP